jgi:hypothetical protein
MVEAEPMISRQRSAVIAALGRQTAIKAVKRQLQAQGIKLYPFAQRAIVAMANGYAAANGTELLAETVERVRQSLELRQLAKACGATASAVRISCPKWRRAEMIVGYARVRLTAKPSTRNKRPSRLGAERVYAEKISGAVTDRKALASALGAGDVLLVTRLDRLARSTRDLLTTLDAVAKAGASFRSLADSWADNTTPHGRLMQTVVGPGRVRARAHTRADRRRPEESSG